MRLAIPALTLTLACFTLPAFAKLPPPSDEAKTKSAETAAKTGWSGKVGAYKLCQAMNRTAEYYHKSEKSAGKEVPMPVETPACTDPGPFVAVAAAPKPLEAAGAHSPTEMATAPPSSKATAAEIQGKSKK